MNIGIIGCGGIASAHIDGYTKNGVCVTALTDINPEAARRQQQERATKAQIFPDVSELLASNVEAVSVCTPPSAREEAILAALSRGIHVLAEKPLAHTLESGRRIAAAADAAEALFMPAFRHRFIAPVLTMKQLIDEGRLGPLVFMNNIFCGPQPGMRDRWFSKRTLSGGGTIMDTSSHSIDLFRFLCGEIVAQCAATHTHLEGIDVEDTSTLVVRGENGTIGSLTASWVAGAGEAFLDVMGRAGRAYYNYADSARLILTTDAGTEELPTEYTGGFSEEIAHFLAAIRGESPLRCTIRDALRALEVAQGACVV